MSTTIAKTFKDLLVWQKAHQMTLWIYTTTNDFPKSELFGLTSQVRRAGVSVPANIVEGFRRGYPAERIRFYTIADASLEEVKYHFLLAHDLNYIQDKLYGEFLTISEEVGKLLTGWIRSNKKFL